jgi:hypothetical protein
MTIPRKRKPHEPPVPRAPSVNFVSGHRDETVEQRLFAEAARRREQYHAAAASNPNVLLGLEPPVEQSALFKQREAPQHARSRYDSGVWVGRGIRFG